MPTFLTWCQHYADSEQQDATGKQLYIQHFSIIFHMGGTNKYKQLTILKPTQIGINRNK